MRLVCCAYVEHMLNFVRSCEHTFARRTFRVVIFMPVIYMGTCTVNALRFNFHVLILFYLSRKQLRTYLYLIKYVIG